ncbi:MAG: TetR/AcrR family transcriptional regulator [Phycisphaeraceae bacterium]|nr:TetR/AcrR family transcriptional regulator [Phycisphaeraceae bacterium]MBX3365683.1 TetR/AcrR family transcriptional regulator [Phycisphaeraceae bacterium]
MAPAETRRRILEVAFRLFHEQGYHATGIATILREANVNSGSLYHYFASKEDLLVGVLEFALEELDPQVMARVRARTSDPIERIFALLEQYRAMMVFLGCRMGCPMGNLALEVADDHPEARRLIHQNFVNWTRHIKGWLDEAGDRLPRALDREQLANFVLTVMEGGIMQARASGTLGPYDDSVAQFRNYFDSLLTLADIEHGRPVGTNRAPVEMAHGTLPDGT